MAETAITPIYIGSPTVTFSEIANGAEGDVTITVPGAAVGRLVLVSFRSKFAAGVWVKQPARCTAKDTVVVTLRNGSGSANTPSSNIADIVVF
jgi:hypothetical protein